jgi:bifunctional UDP-N-acetylglucosamine pyrophosphorylase/glucosamine-1-phosphate N-acetyltransferase
MSTKGDTGLACVILAAGLGTRMKSPLPKVLHRIYDRPMLQYPLETAASLKPEKIIIVVGKNHNVIEDTLKPLNTVVFAVQEKPKGTAHALLTATTKLNGFKGTVLVMNGDTPLVTSVTLKKFLKLHRKHKNSVSFISFIAENPSSYGRVLKDRLGKPLRIIEEQDATEEEKTIKEVNSGIYAIEAHALPLLSNIKLNKRKKEYYLTDIIQIAAQKGIDTGVYCLGNEEEFMGVNTKHDFLKVHEVMRKRIISFWVKKGVNFIDASSVFIAPSVKIGSETLIYPNVYLHGDTKVGKNCTIYPNVRIIDSAIKDNAIIKDSTVIENSIINTRAEVGPFAHIRPGSRIGVSSKIGNFVEVKKSIVGEGTKAMHLSYIGDAKVGRKVNIGAGTITCNYDGVKKHETVIGNGVFVGSDSQLVAPVKLGKGSYIGAGSTITKNVPPGALAISRTLQRNIKHWRKKKR